MIFTMVLKLTLSIAFSQPSLVFESMTAADFAGAFP
jgi:hypothetical protein